MAVIVALVNRNQYEEDPESKRAREQSWYQEDFQVGYELKQY